MLPTNQALQLDLLSQNCIFRGASFKLMKTPPHLGDFFLSFFNNNSPRSGLFLSAQPEFLERGKIFPQIFPEFAHKNRVGIFSTRLLHRLRPKRLCSQSGSQISQLWNYFTYRSLQIFKSCDRCIKIWFWHTITQYWSYYLTWLSGSFLAAQNGQVEMVRAS